MNENDENTSKNAQDCGSAVERLVSKPIWFRAKHGRVSHAWNKVVDHGTQHLVALCRPDLKIASMGFDDSAKTCKKCAALLAC